jgi:hypothetical protein
MAISMASAAKTVVMTISNAIFRIAVPIRGYSANVVVNSALTPNLSPHGFAATETEGDG